jgi:hypothetical protein
MNIYAAHPAIAVPTAEAQGLLSDAHVAADFSGVRLLDVH